MPDLIRLSSILLALFALVSCITTGHVATTFMEMFADFGAELPALTRILATPSKGHWGVLGVAIALGVILKDVLWQPKATVNGLILLVLVMFLMLVALGLFLPMMRMGGGLS